MTGVGWGRGAGGWGLGAGGWRPRHTGELEAGGWELEAGGWRPRHTGELEAGGWRLEAGGLVTQVSCVREMKECWLVLVTQF